MKVILFVGVLIASVLGQAENRCAVGYPPGNSKQLYIFNQSNINYFGSIPVADFNAAIIVLNKFKSVGACSPATAGCIIDSDSNSQFPYVLKNKVTQYSIPNKDWFTFYINAYFDSSLDNVILAFDQLVKAGGCQP